MIVFSVSMVRKLLDIPGVPRREFSGHLQDLGLKVYPQSLRVGGIVKFAEGFSNFPFVVRSSPDN